MPMTPIDAGARLSVDWQVSLSSDFSSFVINGTQTGSWFDDIEAVVYPITQMYTGQQGTFPIARMSCTTQEYGIIP